MKTCFVKGTHITPLSWESLRYPGPRKLLDSLPFGALDFSLMVKYQSDTWVIGDVAKGGGVASRKADPELFVKLGRLHKNMVRVSEVPWGGYDCVISYDPVIDADIIRSYPNVLWCYREMSVSHKRAEDALKKGPHGCYDLYLEERLRARRQLKRIPQSVAFPYAQDSAMMRKLISPTNEPAVFIEPRNIPRRECERAKMRAEFSRACGLPIRNAPFPDFDTVLPKFIPALVSGYRERILRTTDYLKLLGSCKYYLSWRKRPVVGQSLIEAAALGLIIVAPDRSLYSGLLCHPGCVTNAGQPPDLRLIKKIEKDSSRQAKILAHQDQALRSLFQGTLDILDKALEMKKHGA